MRRKVSYLVVFLMVLGLVFSVGLFAGGGGEPKGPVTLVVCIRGLDNPSATPNNQPAHWTEFQRITQHCFRRMLS